METEGTVEPEKAVESQGTLRGNIVIAPPWQGEDGIWYEWIPWDEV